MRINKLGKELVISGMMDEEDMYGWIRRGVAVLAHPPDYVTPPTAMPT